MLNKQSWNVTQTLAGFVAPKHHRKSVLTTPDPKDKPTTLNVFLTWLHLDGVHKPSGSA